MAAQCASPCLRSGDSEDEDFEASEASSTPAFLRAMQLGMIDNSHLDQMLDPGATPERRRGADKRAVKPRAWGEAGKVLTEDWDMACRNMDTPDSREGRLFRHRYCVSPMVVARLLQAMDNDDWYGTRSRDRAQQRNYIPTHIKVLTSLRRLARSETFDTLHQISGVGASTVCADFHNFNRLLVKNLFKIVIRPPEGVEVARILEVNDRVGLPGCLSSTDGVHFVNDKAPATALQVASPTRKNYVVSLRVLKQGHLPYTHVLRCFPSCTETMSPHHRNPRANATSPQFACRCRVHTKQS